MKRSLFFLFLGMSICLTFGQNQSLRVQPYFAEDGLSSSQVRCLLEDSRGFIWVGTLDGLNRFDGYHFRVFKPDERKEGYISSNNIYDLAEDPQGRIWVATLKGGLNMYDPRTERFSSWRHDPEDSLSISSDEVIAVHFDKGGQAWVGTSKGLDKIVETDSGLQFIHIDLLATAPDSKRRSVYLIESDPAGFLWLGSGIGLIRLDPEGGSLCNYSRLSDYQTGWSTGVLRSTHWLEDGSAYFGTGNEGFFHVEFPEGLSVDTPRLQATQLLADITPLNRINELLQFPGSTLLAGTAEGIFAFEELPHQQLEPAYIQHIPDPDDPASLSWKGIEDMLIDRSGSLWIATQNGLNYVSQAQQAFVFLAPDEEDRTHLSSGYITSIWLTEKGDRWSTSALTLEHWNPSTQTYEVYKHDPNRPGSLPYARLVKTIQDRSGQIWVASYGGLCRLESDGSFSVFTHYPDPSLPPYGTRRLLDMLEGPDGDIWLSSYHGILRFDTEQESFTAYKFPRPNNLTEMLWEADGNMLIGGQLGLERFNLTADSFEHVGIPHDTADVLSNVVIKSLHRAKDGSLWIGGREALYRWEEDVQKLSTWYESDGLANAVINAIREDEQGRIWFSTNKGVSMLNPKNGEIRNFDQTDGLGGIGFRSRSAAVGTDGRMYFGGNHGVIYFHPDSIRYNSYLPPIRLTDFQLFNRSVPISPDGKMDSDTFQLAASIGEVEALQLSYRDRVFSIGFSGLSFYQPHKNQYAFRLQGYDEDWSYVGADRRYVTYTNLDPGNYTFELKASNNDGQWNEDPLQLTIRVTPPWWQRWWAYMIYALLGIGAVYTLIRYRTRKVRLEMLTQRRIEQARLAEREKVRARSSRDFHDESGNKITKISLYTGLLRQRLDQSSDLESMLDKIDENVKALGGGMRDFIWALDPKKDRLADMAHRLQEFGQQLFEDSGINFHFHNKVDLTQDYRLDLNIRRQLLLIFKEAMNNCLKYAQSSEVHFRISESDDHLDFAFHDNGLGFDLDQLQRVNGLNNMQHRVKEMGAEIEIKSVPGIGTQITVQVPKQALNHPNG